MIKKNNNNALIIAVLVILVAFVLLILCFGAVLTIGYFSLVNSNQPTEAVPQEVQQSAPMLNLEGIWQKNGSMAAGWTDRYHFYPSGTFHFYPNEMICSQEKIEKMGTWKVENTQLTLTTTKQIVLSLEIYSSGLCSVIDKKEVALTKPGIEQVTIVDHGTQADDIYPSISINDQKFWKFSDDASRYGDDKFPE